MPLKVFLNEPMALAKGVTVALAKGVTVALSKGVIGVCLVAFPSVEAACISFIFLFGTETPLGQIPSIFSIVGWEP